MPNLTLYLTFDLFLGLWNKPGELWTCIIPHVVDDGKGTQLSAWLNDCADGGNFDYAMASYDDPTLKAAGANNNIVPVPFSDNVNVTVDLLNGTAVTVNRRSRLKIAQGQAAAFRQQNEDPTLISLQTSATGIDDMPEGVAFANAYIQGLRPSAGPPSRPGWTADQLRHSMPLALWGGTRRWFSATTLTDLENVDETVTVLQPPTGGDPRTMTNLHSMLGLMVRLGRRATDLAKLKQVTNIRLTLDTVKNGGPVTVIKSFDLGNIPTSGSSIPQFFSNLTDQDMDPSQLQVSWNRQMAQRVYVRRVRTPYFFPTPIGPKALFKRKFDKNAADNQNLTQLGRLNAVLAGQDGPEPRAIPAALTFVPCQVIQGKLQRYRSAPHQQNPGSRSSPEAPTVLRFSPDPKEKAAFDQLLLVNPHLFDATDGSWQILIDDQPQDNLEFIGHYNFPWDQSEPGAPPTYLFLGINPTSNAATLIAKGSAPGRPPPAIVCSHSDFTPADGADLWRGSPAAGADAIPVEAFFPPPELDSSQWARLTVTAEFADDVDFELAQSISQIEDVMTATYPPHGMVGGLAKTPTTLTPSSEYQDDLINYNALNVYTTAADGTHQALNPATELYPVWTTAANVNPPQHVFRFRYHPATFRPDSDSTDARTFYDQIYRSLGTNRRLVVELEHTFGNVIPFATPRLQPQPVDFPVQLPNGIRLPSPTAPKSDPPPPLQPFMWISYSKASTTETAILSFNTDLLKAANAANDQMRESYYAAWRSIAELNYADQIILTARLRIFDFSEALAGNAVSAGLVATTVLPDVTVPINAAMKALTQQLLAGHTSIAPLNITLRSSAPFIWQAADVVDFALKVVRPQAVLPPDAPGGGAWQLFWVPDAKAPDPKNFDQNGMILDAAPGALNGRYSDWRAALASRERVIHTSLADDGTYAALRGALGPDDTAIDEARDTGRILNDGAWIPTPGDPGPDPGQAVAAICPFGFVPLNPNDFLGSRTDLLMRRYTTLMRDVLLLNVQAWLAWDVAKWRTFFDGLQIRVSDPAAAPPGADQNYGALFKFVTAMTNMLFPFPNKDATQPSLDGEIKAVVIRLRDHNDALCGKAMAAVRQALWNDPSVFASTKAFLLTHLRGDTGAIPADFFDLLSEKLAGHGDGLSDQRLLDADVLSYRDAVFSVAANEAAFVENLPEVKYDNNFVLNNFALRRFEYFVKRVLGQPPPSDQHNATYYIPSTIHIPAGLVGNLSDPPEIWLAAREAIIPPTHVVTDYFPQCQSESLLDQTFPQTSRTPVRFDFAMLKVGQLVASSTSTPVSIEMVSRTATQPRSQYLDTYVLSSAFVIVGSEEETKPDSQGHVNPFDGFGLDNFYAECTQPALLARQNAPAPPPNPETESLFSELAAKPDVSTVSSPQAALDTPILNDATAWMTGIDHQSKAPPAGVPPITIGTKGELKIWPISGSDQPFVEAFLFKLVEPSSATNANPSYLLFINLEALRWERSAIGLIQSRNFEQDIARNFAPEFGQISNEVSDLVPHQPLQEIDVYDNPKIPVPPQAMSRLQYSMKDLVVRLLGATNLIPKDQTGEPQHWREFDLAITIHHDQKTPFPTAYPGSTPDSQAFVATSQFPLRAVRAQAHSATQDQPQDWFVDNHKEYTVDFHWFSTTNLPFFGIKGVRVTIV